MSKANGSGPHHHQYRPVGEPWRREKEIARKVDRYDRRGRMKTRVEKRCVKVGPLRQTVYCAGCADRKEIVIREVCG